MFNFWSRFLKNIIIKIIEYVMRNAYNVLDVPVGFIRFKVVFNIFIHVYIY